MNNGGGYERIRAALRGEHAPQMLGNTGRMCVRARARVEARALRRRVSRWTLAAGGARGDVPRAA